VKPNNSNSRVTHVASDDVQSGECAVNGEFNMMPSETPYVTAPTHSMMLTVAVPLAS
jgi:hypothetical protein